MSTLVDRMKQSGRAIALVGALGMSGCATGNPGIDALGNFAGAMMVAEQGRSQQTVVVNTGSPVPYSSVPWKLFTAEYCDDSTKTARGVRNTFFEDESIFVLASGPASQYLCLEVYDAQGKKIKKKELDTRPEGPNSFMGGIFLNLPGNTLSPGNYEFSVYNIAGFKEKSSFKVQSRSSNSQ